MINFIICDDEKPITDSVKKIVTNVMFKNNMDYKIHVFHEYNNDFYKISKSDLENKIYILDIEVGKKSGIDVAKLIRKNDWDSTILILTSHYELEFLAYKSKILLFDFISKFDLYDQKMQDTINFCVNKKVSDNKLVIKTNRKIEQINFSSILYITYDNYSRKTKVITKNEEYETNESLKEISRKLKGNFVPTHRACIVNLNNIKTIDTKNKVITFVDDTTTELLSRNHIKDVKNYGNNGVY